MAAAAPAIWPKEKKQHASGVWVHKPPTGIKLTVRHYAKMDHSNGKAWEIVVWNPIENPGGGNAVVNSLSFPRLYEELSRSLITIPFLGKLKDENLQNLEPHARIYPTGFSQPTNEFKGTLLSCLDLVYCDSADKTKPYNEWRGQLDDNEETNTLRFISEICAGYYVKLNTNNKPIKDKT